MPFGGVARLRIVDAAPARLFEALGAPHAWLLLSLWVALLVTSLPGARSRTLALIRGLLAGAAIPVLLWLSGVAAVRSLAPLSPLARYSMGSGVWLAAFAAFALVMASRHEVGDGGFDALLVALLPLAGIAAVIATGGVVRLGIVVEYHNVSSDLLLWTGQHVAYSAIALTIAVAFGVALGIFAHRSPKAADAVFTTTSVFQTIPGLAMIGILAVPLGLLAEKVPAAHALGIGVLGWAPIVVALTLYALLAIVRNTYAGLNSVPGSIVEAARGMGLSGGQVLRKVELPLAAPIIFSGVRIAAQQTIGNATLGVFVAAGTLGRPIFGGVAQTATDLVLLGSITLVTLALLTDGLMRAAQRLVSPRRSKGAR